MDESYFARPFVEVDEWRDDPVRHRYVHGGFDGTETQFSLYFPPSEQYEGRFLHHIEGGGGGTPRAQPNDIALACSYGGYLVVSNQGHIGPDATHLDREIHHYGASVATASSLARRRGGDVRRSPSPWLHLGRERRGRSHDRDPRARARPLPGRGRVHPPARRAAGAVRGGGQRGARPRRLAGVRRRRHRARRERRPVRRARRRATRRARRRVPGRFPTRRRGPDLPGVDRAERRGSRARRLRSRLLRRLLDRTGIRRLQREPAERAHPVDARRPSAC